MKKVEKISDIEENFDEEFVGIDGEFISGIKKNPASQKYIKDFYRQQITELLEQIPVEEKDDGDFGETKGNQYLIKICIDRAKGYNQKVEEIKQILNNINK